MKGKMQKENNQQPLRDLRERTYGYARRIIRIFRGLPKDDVARTLGLAQGSIGFIRGKCLDKLRARLEEKGF